MKEIGLKERVLASRLIEKINKNDNYSNQIGLSYEIVDRNSEKAQVGPEERAREYKEN